MQKLTSGQIYHLQETSEAFRQGVFYGRGTGASEILDAIDYCNTNLTPEQRRILGEHLIYLSGETE